MQFLFYLNGVRFFSSSKCSVSYPYQILFQRTGKRQSASRGSMFIANVFILLLKYQNYLFMFAVKFLVYISNVFQSFAKVSWSSAKVSRFFVFQCLLLNFQCLLLMFRKPLRIFQCLLFLISVFVFKSLLFFSAYF